MLGKHIERHYGEPPRFSPLHLIIALVLTFIAAAGLYFLIWYNLFYIAVTMISFISLICGIRQIVQINWGIQHSCCTTAVITEYKVHTHRVKRHIPCERYELVTKYTPVLQYQTEEGIEIRSMYLPSSEHKRYREGESVTIQYLPNFPKICYYSENEHKISRKYWYPLAISFVVFIFSLFYFLGTLM